MSEDKQNINAMNNTGTIEINNCCHDRGRPEPEVVEVEVDEALQAYLGTKRLKSWRLRGMRFEIETMLEPKLLKTFYGNKIRLDECNELSKSRGCTDVKLTIEDSVIVRLDRKTAAEIRDYLNTYLGD